MHVTKQKTSKQKRQRKYRYIGTATGSVAEPVCFYQLRLLLNKKKQAFIYFYQIFNFFLFLWTVLRSGSVFDRLREFFSPKSAPAPAHIKSRLLTITFFYNISSSLLEKIVYCEALVFNKHLINVGTNGENIISWSRTCTPAPTKKYRLRLRNTSCGRCCRARAGYFLAKAGAGVKVQLQLLLG